MDRTLVQGLAAALRARGVRRAFGVPGGGSSLDVIDALAAEGIDFVLTGGETGGALMAAVTAELGGAPGVAIAAVGPGAASAVNGIAYASLERAPVLLITDVAAVEEGRHALHQRLDQGALFAPLAKGCLRPAPGDGLGRIEALLDAATAHPAGPVQIDLSVPAAAAPAGGGARGPAAAPAPAPDPGAIAAAGRLLAGAARPLIVAGMEARAHAASTALRAFARALGCPVMTTYKAKGAIAETAPLALGCFTGAAAEARCLEAVDLLILFGLDPVELIPGRWPFDRPILSLSVHRDYDYPAVPTVAVHGALRLSAAALVEAPRAPAWREAELAALRDRLRGLAAMAGAGARTAQDVVAAVRRAAPGRARLTVDSGAHMFSAMALWRAGAPNDVLKSNGLSTMGFALPAAVAAALEEPARPVIAMTGDGGLQMCLAELATAARLGCRIVVVVLNDSRLSLIDVKQQRQQRPCKGVRYQAIDYAAVARGLGCGGDRVSAADPLEPALARAFARDGPVLVDAAIDPAAYNAQFEALRG